MPDLPKRDERHVIGEEAVDLVKKAFPRKWIIREQGGDYGIDVEIEVADEFVTGTVFKAQVRGHEHIPWTLDQTYSQAIKSKHLQYWAVLPVPVVLLVPETSTGAVHWCRANGDPGLLGRGSLVVERARTVAPPAEDVLKFVFGWMSASEGQSVIFELPRIGRTYGRLLQATGRDTMSWIDSELLEDAYFFHRDTVRLRQALGLGTSSVFPWAVWISRSQLPGDCDGLLGGVFDEMMAHLAPLFEEARDAVFERLRDGRIEADGEGWLANNFMAEVTQHYVYQTPRATFGRGDESLWQDVERELESLGALKLRFAGMKW